MKDKDSNPETIQEPSWEEISANLKASAYEGLAMARETAKLMGWREDRPLRDNLRNLWTYWTEKVDVDKPSVALHEAGHGLAAALFGLNVEEITVGQSRSLLSRNIQALLYPNSLEASDSIGGINFDSSSLDAMQLGAVNLAGFAATSLEDANIDREKRNTATENLEKQHMIEEWTDVSYPYRAVVWEWTRINEAAPTPQQVLAVIDLWIEELANVFRQEEPLLRALQQGLLKRPQIHDGKKFIEETIQETACTKEDLARMKTAIVAIRLEELIAKIKQT